MLHRNWVPFTWISIHESSANDVLIYFFRSLCTILVHSTFFQRKLTIGLCRSVQFSKRPYFLQDSSFEFLNNHEVIIRSRQCINVSYLVSPPWSCHSKNIWWFCACLPIARDLHFRSSWVEEIEVQLSVWPTLSSTKDGLLGLAGLQDRAVLQNMVCNCRSAIFNFLEILSEVSFSIQIFNYQSFLASSFIYLFFWFWDPGLTSQSSWWYTT